jgi:Uma2 family endonuclease
MPRALRAPEPAKLMTLEEWAALDDEVEGELVDGVLEGEEMPSFLHEIVVAWFIRVVGSWVRRRRGQVAASETKIAVGIRRGRKPDLSVYLPSGMPALLDPLVRTPPHVVVEVASPRPRDIRRDRVDKIADYARARVPYYWIIDPALRSFEVFELGRDRRYTLALSAGAGRVRVPGCPRLSIDLDQLWGEVDEAARLHAQRSRRPRRRNT